MKILLDDLVTDNFTWREMLTSTTAIRLGLDNTPESDEIYDNIRLMAETLEIIRGYYSKPIRVLSCYRSFAVNRAVGGSKTSAHCKALAVDFTVKDTPIIEVCRWCRDNLKDYDQIIFEFNEWIHYGKAANPRHQILSAVKEGGKTVYKKGLEE